jgi:hypothetical protein
MADDARCARCGVPLSSYFEVAGSPFCEACKDLTVKSHEASHLPTLLRAAGLGLVTAAIGAGIYYAIAAITGYEFGLMSIVLGLMVGMAVRNGARGRGGWRYQALAMFLCYAAICATYVPRIIAAARNQGVAAAPAPSAGSTQTVQASTLVQPAAARPAEPPAVEGPPTAGRFFKALGMLFLFSLALPFLAGAENLMGLVIIAVGLYEAWKVNRGSPYSVSGPFLVGEGRGS